MSNRALLVMMVLGLGMLAGAQPWASKWIEVKSPHFVVVSDGGEGAARHVAGQMERMRGVFHQMFPGLEVDPAAPLEVLAVRNEDEMRKIEPAAYLGRRSLDLAGYFQSGPDRNLILLDLQTGQDPVPYRTVYHEYTHLMANQEGEAMPVWLSEGLAEVYENIRIEDHEADIGMAEQDRLHLLQESQLFPLRTLLEVDHNSPYYHEEGKGTLFYAESWALTHYLVMRQRKENSELIENYLTLLNNHVDSFAAATQAFGDLDKLQTQLQDYINRGLYPYVRMRLTEASVDEKTFAAIPLTEGDGNAVLADYMAHNQRYEDATHLLDAVLHADADNARAHAVMGFIALAHEQWAAAETSFGQAIALEPDNFLTQYYFGMAGVGDGSGELDAADAAKVEASLRTAIRLNPRFAPAYDCLAVLYARRREQLDQAHLLELQAVTLDPGVFIYRINTASILLEMGDPANAALVMRQAIPLASSADEVAEAKQVQAKIEKAEAASKP